MNPSTKRKEREDEAEQEQPPQKKAELQAEQNEQNEQEQEGEPQNVQNEQQQQDEQKKEGEQQPKRLRVYSDGIFDLFHFGHARLFKQIKDRIPGCYLIVGVCGDEVTHRLKGKTVMTDTERYESIRHCKWVDEVIEDAPWVVTQEFLDAHQIDLVAHDDIPYASKDTPDVYKFVKDQGKFFATERTGGISTSDLITRIVRGYDAYVRRNLKKGITGKEMNIGFVKERAFKIENTLEEAKEIVKTRLEKETKDLRKVLEGKEHTPGPGFIANTQDTIREFLALFGRNRDHSSNRSVSPIYDSPASSQPSSPSSSIS